MERWFVKKEGLVLGPYTVEELRTYVVRGKVTALDLVSRDGESGWTSIRQVPQLGEAATEAAAPAVHAETAPATPAPAWHVARGSQVVGPLDLGALRAAIAQGQVRLDDQVCEVGATAWVAVADVDVLRDVFPRSVAPHGSEAQAQPRATAATPPSPLDAPAIGELASPTTTPPPNMELVGAPGPQVASTKRGGQLVVIAAGMALLLVVAAVVSLQSRAGAPPTRSVGTPRSASASATATRISPATQALTDAAHGADPASIPYMVTGSVLIDDADEIAGMMLIAGKPIPRQDWPLTNCEVRVGLPIRARTDLVFNVPRISALTHEPTFERACTQCGCYVTDRCTPQVSNCMAAHGWLLCPATRPRSARPGGFVVHCSEGAVAGLMRPQGGRAEHESLAVAATLEGCFPVGAVFPSGEVCRGPMTFAPAPPGDAP